MPCNQRVWLTPHWLVLQPALEKHAAAINAANAADATNAASINALQTALEKSAKTMAESVTHVQEFLHSTKSAVDSLSAASQEKSKSVSDRIEAIVTHVSDLEAKLERSSMDIASVTVRGSLNGTCDKGNFVALPSD